MKKLLLGLITIFICMGIRAQKPQVNLYTWSLCTVNNSHNYTKTNITSGGYIMVDELRNKISIPQLNIHFAIQHIDHLPGYMMYINNDYGQLVVSENLSIIRLEFFSGDTATYEFRVLKNISKIDSDDLHIRKKPQQTNSI